MIDSGEKPKGRGTKIFSKYSPYEIRQHAKTLSDNDWRIFQLRCAGYSYKQIAIDEDYKTYFVRKRLRIISYDLDKLIDWNEAMK